MRPLKLKKVEVTAKNISTFYFEPEKAWDYTPGQYIELYVPHDNPDERGDKRWFTLSSSPTEPLLSITTKFNEKSSSFKKKLRSLHPGETLLASESIGDFVLPKDKSLPLTLVASGIGVNPYRSMVKWLIDTNQKRSIQLIYGTSELAEVAFADLFNNYDLGLDIVLKRPPSNWSGQSGPLTAKKIISLCGVPKDGLLYLSGAEPQIEELRRNLLKLGVSKDQLVTDLFLGYMD